MLLLTCVAMYSITSGSTFVPSSFARRFRIAMRVSKSGGCTSAARPHWKRLSRRSSMPTMSFGGRSAESTNCLPCWWSSLKMWKNSSCVFSLPPKNWTSSMIRMSTPR